MITALYLTTVFAFAFLQSSPALVQTSSPELKSVYSQPDFSEGQLLIGQDAALHYYRAIVELAEQNDQLARGGAPDILNSTLDYCLDESDLNVLASGNSEETIDAFELVLDEIHIAAQCDAVSWREKSAPLGYFPEIQKFRTISRLVATKARIQIAKGQYGEARSSIADLVIMSMRVAEFPSELAPLTACFGLGAAADRLEELINLDEDCCYYWYLNQLPTLNFATIERREQMRYLRQFTFLDSLMQEYCDPGELLERINISRRTIFDDYDVKADSIIDRQVLLGIKGPSHTLNYKPKASFSIEQRGLAILLSDFLNSGKRYFRWLDDKGSGAMFLNNQFDQDAEKYREAFVKLDFVLSGGILARTGTLGFAEYSMPYLKYYRRIALLQARESIREFNQRFGRLPDINDEIDMLPLPPDPQTGREFDYRIINGNTFEIAASNGEGTIPARWQVELVQ